jgi:hypothetical protein
MPVMKPVLMVDGKPIFLPGTQFCISNAYNDKKSKAPFKQSRRSMSTPSGPMTIGRTSKRKKIRFTNSLERWFGTQVI